MDGSQGVRQDGVHLHGRRRVGGEVQGRLPPAQVSRPLTKPLSARCLATLH